MSKQFAGVHRIFLLTFLLSMFPALALAASAKDKDGVVDPNKCGGVGQPTCELSAAKYLGKTTNPRPSGAFFDPRKGGEYWKCPSDRPRRTLYAVTDSRACATKSLWPFEKLAPAKYMGKVHKSKPSGAFVDLRKGGEYWKCPAGFWRNLNPVTHKAACTVNVGQNCDKGNIDVGNPFGGYTCYKRKVFGKINQRPCLIVERFPTCNRGLAEDFIANRCIDKEVAACLTMTRTFGFAKEVSGIVSKAMKLAAKARQELFKRLPGYDKIPQEAKDNISMAEQQLFGSGSDNTMDDLLTGAKFLSAILPEFEQVRKAVQNNKKGIVKYFTDTSMCTLSQKKRMAKLGELHGFKPKKSTVQRAALELPAWYENILLKSARAATTKNVYFTLGVNVTATYFAGVTYDFYLATNFADQTALYMGVGPALTTSQGLSVAVPIGITTADSLDDVGGWGASIGVSVQNAKEKIGYGVDIGVNDFLKEGKIVVQGVALTISPGESSAKTAAEASVSYSHSWRLGKH